MFAPRLCGIACWLEKLRHSPFSTSMIVLAESSGILDSLSGSTVTPPELLKHRAATK